MSKKNITPKVLKTSDKKPSPVKQEENKAAKAKTPKATVGRAVAGLIIKKVINPVVELVSPSNPEKEVKKAIRTIERHK